MRQPSRALVIIVVLSVVARFGTSLALDDQLRGLPGTADQLSYHVLAQGLLEGRGFSFESDWWPSTAAEAPTAHWSFLYTYFLAAVYGLVGPRPSGHGPHALERLSRAGRARVA